MSRGERRLCRAPFFACGSSLSCGELTDERLISDVEWSRRQGPEKKRYAKRDTALMLPCIFSSVRGWGVDVMGTGRPGSEGGVR
jgi:hypothetical protein